MIAPLDLVTAIVALELTRLHRSAVAGPLDVEDTERFEAFARVAMSQRRADLAARGQRRGGAEFSDEDMQLLASLTETQFDEVKDIMAAEPSVTVAAAVARVREGDAE